MNRNWIKLHRKIRNSKYYPIDNFSKFEAFIDILLMVKWKPGTQEFDGGQYKLDPGEMVTKQRLLANRWGWSIGKVNRFINGKGLNTKQVEEKRNTVAEHDSGTRGFTQTITKIVVENWKDYQSDINGRIEHESGTRQRNIYNKEGNTNKEGSINTIRGIFDVWNKQGVIVHRDFNKYKSDISGRLRIYSADDIEAAIKNFGRVFNSPDTIWTYKWTLNEFLQRKNGLDKFIPDNFDYGMYTKNKGKKNYNYQSPIGRYDEII